MFSSIIVECIFLIVIVTAMYLFISRRVIKPIREIRLGAIKFLEGDLSHRFSVHGSDEVKALASTMNQMAAELQRKIDRLKEIEDMRREFVANVSHELKTPVASIQGFAETLRDGAISDPEKAKQFLEIVAAHAGRLSAIIEDLLQLSRIEQEAENPQIIFERHSIKIVLEAAKTVCDSKALEKNIILEVKCDDGLTENINSVLLEQAVSNLIDNAIKYSEKNSVVKIEASSEGKNIRIEVKDSGCGIPKEHLPRIFDRFYRVDKGRSRKLGGTGLGLAIVKHIAQVHGGYVSVESTVDQGSTFVIHIPSEHISKREMEMSD